MTATIGIFIFDGVEVLDFAGPFEVFSVASRISGRIAANSAPPFRPILIAMQEKPVHARGGFRVLPDYTIHKHPKLDVLIVPGGLTEDVQHNAEVLAWVRREAASARLVASVCTGAFVLAQAGLLDGKRAATHHEDEASLATQFPSLSVVSGVSWVDEGAVLSSGGISAGIDMSLHLVERLQSREAAEATAAQMEFRRSGK